MGYCAASTHTRLFLSRSGIFQSLQGTIGSVKVCLGVVGLCSCGNMPVFVHVPTGVQYVSNRRKEMYIDELCSLLQKKTSIHTIGIKLMSTTHLPPLCRLSPSIKSHEINSCTPSVLSWRYIVEHAISTPAVRRLFRLTFSFFLLTSSRFQTTKNKERPSALGFE